METSTSITVTPSLNGNVKVAIEVGRECLVFIWRMTVAEAQAEAEEVASRMGR